MNIGELETLVKTLEARLETQESIEEIKKLQRSFGYYLEHGMCEETIDLFADDPNAALWHAGRGSFLGKAGIRRFFESFSKDSKNPEFLHQIIQLSGIVNVNPDGKTANGRWYGLGTIAMPIASGVIPTNIGVIYENDYLKEDGKWKIKVLRIYGTHKYNVPEGGIVKPERVAKDVHEAGPLDPAVPDVPDDTITWYPSGYIVPFHFKHPVTGRETSEGDETLLSVP